MGIVEYARTVLKLKRLVCLPLPGKGASEAVARKLGMRFEREGQDAFGRFLLYACSLNEG